ncbi:MAG: hypothetical protein ACLGGY_05220 [Gammaproteobacteria bacterium]
MNTLSSPLMLFAILATGLPGAGHSADAVVRAQPRAMCPPVAAATVPAEYWLYHALVASTPTLTPPVSAASRVRTACTAGKVIRT